MLIKVTAGVYRTSFFVSTAGTFCTSRLVRAPSFEDNTERFNNLSALQLLGFVQPTLVQNLSYSPVRKGQDVIIGAETGSGKTLAYALPLIDSLIATASLMPSLLYPRAIIFAPNKDLCKQIMSMCSGLVEGLQAKGVSISMELAAGAGGMYEFGDSNAPDIVVCTPRHLSNQIKGPVISDKCLFESIRHVVLDEADMLLDGSYLKDVEKILEAFKVVRRDCIRRGDIKVHEKRTQFVLVAATLASAGKRSVQSCAQALFPNAELVRTEHMHTHHPSITQDFVQVNLVEMRNDGDPFDEQAVLVGSKEHARIVLSAILKADEVAMGVGAEEMSRKANPVSGIPATPELLKSARVRECDVDLPKCPSHQVMIFLNTAHAAQSFAMSVRAMGTPCVEYHKLVSSIEREKNVHAFRAGDQRILVCTDSAARGLDFPNVRHVIQAEFALNVVQHQHRVGRASRAGRAGRSTNFYGSSAQALVESIVGASSMEKLQPNDTNCSRNEPSERGISGKASIEQSFSRRRGFRKHLKREQQWYQQRQQLLQGDEEQL